MDKHHSVDLKSTCSIPTPVVAYQHKSSRNKGKWLHFALAILLLSAVHIWVRPSLIPRLKHDEHSERQHIFEAYVRSAYKAHKGLLRGKQAEKLFLTIPDEDSALAASRLFAGKPHMAGTPGDLDTAKDFLALLQHELGVNHTSEPPVFAAGSDESRAATLDISSYNEPKAWIDTYYPILNSPLDRSLQILGEDGKLLWTAELEEVADETDPYAYKYATTVPTWHGLSHGGEARGKLVFANYGRKEDYDALVDAGVDLTGKIVITRYGSIFRGLKVKRAQELGAAAVLIYSDPRDDGTVTIENGYVPYPHGPARNPTSVQRGSVQFLSLYPGDPSTPGYPSYENSTRAEGANKPLIPSLPISWANAEVLLKHIMNHKGPTVRLVNNVDEKITPIWNTMGVIPGHIKDEVVVLGNHRDVYFPAWVLGASDPSSGTVSVHEAVRGFGALLRSGWKPLRTIVIASWDGEEYGLVGSTEWGEDFTEWIREHVVAYVNLDTSAAGSRLRASASPLLAHLLRETAEQIPHPTSKGRSLWDAHLDSGTLFGGKLDAEVVAMDREAQSASDNLGVNPLGSGSDYTVFLQYIGVPSAEAGFKSTLHDPVYHYHSVFDSQHWQEVYGDPGFSRHVAIAKHIGLQVLRLCDDIVLPLNTTHYAHQLEAYLERVEVLSSLDVDLSPLRESIKALQTASAQLDTEKTAARHELKKALHRFNKTTGLFHGIRRSVRKSVCKLQRILGCECHTSKSKQIEEGFRSPNKRLLEAIKRVQAVNDKLIAFERGFISKEGIKDREWYKHLGVAPGKWLGYGATTLPGLTEAITIDKDVAAAAWEAERLKVVVDNLTKEITV